MSAQPLSQAEVEAEGIRLGQSLPPGSVVWLLGGLGAGKTTLVRSIVRGRGILASASSPTYALVHHYAGAPGDVYHVDCYRLRHPDEAVDLDWATLVASNLLLIEWPERAGEWAPAPTHTIALTTIDDDHRALELR